MPWNRLHINGIVDNSSTSTAAPGWARRENTDVTQLAEEVEKLEKTMKALPSDPSDIVTKNADQKLTHKILEEPMISSIQNYTYTGTHANVIARLELPLKSGTLATLDDCGGGIDVSTLVDLDSTQTISNKLLDSTCKVSDNSLLSSNGQVIEFPNGGTLATTANVTAAINALDLSQYATKTGNETLQNKTLDASTTTLNAPTIKYSNGSGQTITNSLPNKSGTLATLDDCGGGTPPDLSNYVDLTSQQTVSNKMFDASCGLTDNTLIVNENTRVVFPEQGQLTNVNMVEGLISDSINALDLSAYATKTGQERLTNKTFDSDTCKFSTATIQHWGNAGEIINTLPSRNGQLATIEDIGGGGDTSNFVDLDSAQRITNKQLTGYCQLYHGSLLGINRQPIYFPDEGYIATKPDITAAINAIDFTPYATKTGEETLQNKTFDTTTTKFDGGYITYKNNRGFTISNNFPGKGGTLATLDDIGGGGDMSNYVDLTSEQTMSNKTLNADTCKLSNGIIKYVNNGTTITNTLPNKSGVLATLDDCGGGGDLSNYVDLTSQQELSHKMLDASCGLSDNTLVVNGAGGSSSRVLFPDQGYLTNVDMVENLIAENNNTLNLNQYATKTGEETLTNKTFNGDNCKIAGASIKHVSNNATITNTLPSKNGVLATLDDIGGGGDTSNFVDLTSEQTVSNKTFTSCGLGSNTFQYKVSGTGGSRTITCTLPYDTEGSGTTTLFDASSVQDIRNKYILTNSCVFKGDGVFNILHLDGNVNHGTESPYCVHVVFPARDCELAGTDDRARHQTGEKADVKAKIQDIGDRLHLTSVNIHQITDTLEDIKRYSNRQQNLTHVKMGGGRQFVCP